MPMVHEDGAMTIIYLWPFTLRTTPRQGIEFALGHYYFTF